MSYVHPSWNLEVRCTISTYVTAVTHNISETDTCKKSPWISIFLRCTLSSYASLYPAVALYPAVLSATYLPLVIRKIGFPRWWRVKAAWLSIGEEELVARRWYGTNLTRFRWSGCCLSRTCCGMMVWNRVLLFWQSQWRGNIGKRMEASVIPSAFSVNSCEICETANGNKREKLKAKPLWNVE